jgi:membrane dipeptidase
MILKELIPIFSTLYLGLSSLALAGSQAAVNIDEARKIHQSILTLDTHVDFSLSHFKEEKNITDRLNGVQVDLPKMTEGGLDAAFFIVYVTQMERSNEGYEKAYGQAIEKFNAIHNLAGNWGAQTIDLALSSSDVGRIVSKGKKVALIGVENAYSMGTDLSRVDEFYDLGARYVGIMHNGHNQFGDSNFPKGDDAQEIYGGLSPLGRDLVKLLNKKGLVIDISHASKKTRLDIIQNSKTPVVDSHSALTAFYDHTRNIDDEVLGALVKKGGVIQIVAFQSYLLQTPAEKIVAINNLARKYGFPEGNMWTEGNKVFAHFPKASKEERMGYWNGFQELERSSPHANVKDLVNQVDYVVKNYGIDYVGISSDFGGGGGLGDWQDASETFNVTLELIRRGYTKEDIEKIWSGNYLRVWREAEIYSQQAN